MDSTEKFHILHASEFLEKGQSFFDQEPFSTVIAEVSQQYGVSILILSAALGQIGRSTLATRLRDNDRMEGLSFLNVLADKIFTSTLFTVCKIEKGEARKPIRLAFRKIFFLLEDYPYWAHYILYQWISHVYDFYGAYIFDANGFNHPAPSYAAWVTEQLEVDLRIKDLAANLVAKEAFTQDFSFRSSGKRKINRQYMILKASELHSLEEK